jgi:hypothetical protein
MFLVNQRNNLSISFYFYCFLVYTAAKNFIITLNIITKEIKGMNLVLPYR